MVQTSEILVAPSLLSADFGKLAEETQRMEKSGADWVHIDVMDGHFVPNLTVGPQAVAALRPVTKLPLDVHLMIEQPEKYGPLFIKAGADRITVHAEACRNLKQVVLSLRQLGVKVGVAFRPQTGIEALTSCLKEIDLVLVMTVHPGFGGQAFMPEMLPKIKAVRALYSGHIQVDGGINDQTAKMAREAGADVMVAGTYIFQAADARGAIASLKGTAPAPKRTGGHISEGDCS